MVPSTAVLDRIEIEALRCHQCSQCSGVCPSLGQGGINPREIMMRHAEGISEVDGSVLWLCTMCHSCVERCQLEASPAELIKELRGRSAENGNVPKAFAEEAKLFQKTGLSFPNSGLTKKMRKELGLGDIVVETRTLEELTHLVQNSRLGRLRLE